MKGITACEQRGSRSCVVLYGRLKLYMKLLSNIHTLCPLLCSFMQHKTYFFPVLNVEESQKQLNHEVYFKNIQVT